MKRCQWHVAMIVVIVACACLQVQAGLFTLVDLNSTVSVNTQTQAGFYDWTVEGTPQMPKQWFWLGVNGGAEFSIDQLTLVQGKATDADFDAGNEHLVVQYKNTGQTNLYTVELTATLGGANVGSHTADLSEAINISNTSATQTFNFRFYQYADFDLAGTPVNDMVELINGTTVYQYEYPVVIAENFAADVPPPNFAELGYYPTTLNRLNDGVADNLLIDLGSASYPVVIGPGNVTWAFQWNFTLAPGQSFLISKDKWLSIPEPTTLGLLTVAGLMLLRRRMPR